VDAGRPTSWPRWVWPDCVPSASPRWPPTPAPRRSSPASTATPTRGTTSWLSGPGSRVFHIGRRHIRDAHGDPVVIDWRVPVARSFYQATAGERMGLHLRRRFGFHDGVLTSYEDEHLDQARAWAWPCDLLREEIERPARGTDAGHRRDHPARPDDLVRAVFEHSLCIQGAPGTGKTAVGLHRAAYLLYTLPGPPAALRRPGRRAQLGLPALHRRGAADPSERSAFAQSTVDELLRGQRQPAGEDDARATLKGDPRMADLLRRAVLSYVRKPLQDLMVPTRSVRYRVPASRLRRLRRRHPALGRAVERRP